MIFLLFDIQNDSKWTTFEVCEDQGCAQQLCGHEIYRIYLKILIWDMKMKEK